MDILNALKSYDWRKLQRLASPHAADDLNEFLERMPQRVGNNALIAAGISWMMAASLGLYATVQAQQLTTLRAELADMQALKPIVPTIRDVPVGGEQIKDFAAQMQQIYPAISVKQQGSAIYITAASTDMFGVFREAVGHVQNGGSGWRVNLERLCVGRECKKEKLGALLRINKVSVDKPQQE